jgi:type VI secretion system protein ImpH
MAFPERTIASFKQGADGPSRLETYHLGVFGPNGPMPLHVTEYARERLRNARDATFARFMDVFHHRIATLFYRAYADAEPTIARDRPASDRFTLYVGALIGIGLASTRNRDGIPDATRLHYAGLLARQTRDADGLAALVGDLFRAEASVEQFVGEWVEIPPGDRARLGQAHCVLGSDAPIGTRAFIRSGRFRLVLGPLGLEQFRSFLPGSPRLEALARAVRAYAGDELAWDLRLVLARSEWRPAELGRAHLGWDSWVGRRTSSWKRAELELDPVRGASLAKGPRRSTRDLDVLPSTTQHAPELAHV